MKLERREIEVISKLFVDREYYLRCFDEIISSKIKKKRIFCIHGERTIGKTYLLKKIMLECQKKGLTIIFLDCRSEATTFTNFLSILRAIHKDFNQPFTRYQKAVENGLSPYFKQLKIQTGSGSSGTGAVITGEVQDKVNGEFAGRDINNFYIRIGDDRVLQEPGVRGNITKKFLKDIVEYMKDSPILFFFDEIGSLKKPIQEWLIKDFIRPLCEDLPSPIFVLAKEENFDQDLQQFIADIAKKIVLKEFSGTKKEIYRIYREYLIKNDIPKEELSSAFMKVMDNKVMRHPNNLFEFLLILLSEEED